MVMDAVGSAASAVGEALGLIKPDKAKLVVRRRRTCPSGPHEIECMFNPTDYTLTQTVDGPQRPPTPRAAGGTPQYGGTGAMTLHHGRCSSTTSRRPRATSRPRSRRCSAGRSRPRSSRDPTAAARRSSSSSGAATRSSSTSRGSSPTSTVTYTVFRKDGTPVQAEVAITITGQAEPPSGAQNPTSHATNSRRDPHDDRGRHAAVGRVPRARQGRPTGARSPSSTSIDDPLRLAPGTVLLIPSVADAARGLLRPADGRHDRSPSSASSRSTAPSCPHDIDASSRARSSSTDSRCRTCSRLVFRDPDRDVLGKANLEIGTKVKISTTSARDDGPSR